jgi:hypothetical protein
MQMQLIFLGCLTGNSSILFFASGRGGVEVLACEQNHQNGFVASIAVLGSTLCQIPSHNPKQSFILSPNYATEYLHSYSLPPSLRLTSFLPPSDLFPHSTRYVGR